MGERWSAFANLAILTSIACGRAPPPTPPAPNTTTFTLSCASPIGPIDSQVTYTLTASAEPVQSGSTVTYTITPPSTSAQPLTPTFISSTSSYSVPAGLAIDSVQVQAASTANYSSVTATVDGGAIELQLLGSFPMDSTVRPVPAMIIASHVTAGSGATITWLPPAPIVGEASAGVFGTQTSSCTIESPAPIGTTHVD
jgi:hypothetical protein